MPYLREKSDFFLQNFVPSLGGGGLAVYKISKILVSQQFFLSPPLLSMDILMYAFLHISSVFLF